MIGNDLSSICCQFEHLFFVIWPLSILAYYESIFWSLLQKNHFLFRLYEFLWFGKSAILAFDSKRSSQMYLYRTNQPVNYFCYSTLEIVRYLALLSRLYYFCFNGNFCFWTCFIYLFLLIS